MLVRSSATAVERTLKHPTLLALRVRHAAARPLGHGDRSLRDGQIGKRIVEHMRVLGELTGAGQLLQHAPSMHACRLQERRTECGTDATHDVPSLADTHRFDESPHAAS
jgi:hypothetical protein